MLAEVQEIQRGFVALGFEPRDDFPGIPKHVPDGDYEVPFRGRTVRVSVVDGYLDLRGLAAAPSDALVL